jgi:hypothetical protein
MMVQEITTQQHIHIPYPEIGSEQLLLFTTCIEKKDEKGRLDVDLFKRRVNVVYLGKTGNSIRYQLFLYESTLELSARLDKYNVLLTRMSYVFDECYIAVDESGHLVEVLNWEFIQYRWEVIKSRLLPDFEGEKFAPFFEEMEARVKDKESILDFLQQPSMYGLYFNGYRDLKEQEVPISYRPLFEDNDPLTIVETVTAQEVRKQDNQIVTLEIQGAEEGSASICLEGQFRYLDGLLHDGFKELNIGSQHSSYSVKWVGLKKVLPE